MSTIAALFVDPAGCYANLPGVEVWDEARDARTYRGPHPVVAHPPCQRWGRFWHGSPRKPHQFKLGADDGCFEAALVAVRRWGGVLEHPADSHAWTHFGLNRPRRGGGWIVADFHGGWTCYVEQGHYGHAARKPTWLYAFGVELPELEWGRLPQRLDQKMVERHGYEYARRKGLVSMVGGKDKVRIRNATPEMFRDLLRSIARTAALPAPVSSRPACSAPPASDGSQAGGPSRRPSSPCAPATQRTPAQSNADPIEDVAERALDKGLIGKLMFRRDELHRVAFGIQRLGIVEAVHAEAKPGVSLIVEPKISSVERRHKSVPLQLGTNICRDVLSGLGQHDLFAVHASHSVAVSNNVGSRCVAVNNKIGGSA